MCSIFGFIAAQGQNVPLSQLQRMASANVERGPHAFGFAWIDPAGRLHCYKQAGRITDHLALLAMTRGARLLIGHVRYATHGRPEHNINNHPHPVDGGWLVHNGVVTNYCDLIKQHDLHPVSDCDSESIGLLIERQPKPRLLERARRALGLCQGRLALLGLWGGSTPRLIVARAGNPLCRAATAQGRLFSTLPQGLPNCAREVEEDTICQYRLASGLKGILNAQVCQIQRHQNLPHPSDARRETDPDHPGGAPEYLGG